MHALRITHLKVDHATGVYVSFSSRTAVWVLLPYYRKLTLHEIKVLEINATQINANLMENNFRIKKINTKEKVEFHNKGN